VLGEPVAERLLGADFERIDLFLVGPGLKAQDSKDADVEAAGLVAFAVARIDQSRIVGRPIDFRCTRQGAPAPPTLEIH
jgi:hypothetical protein